MSRRVVARAASSIVSMTLDASQQQATISRLGADGVVPAHRDDPLPAVLAAACATRQRTLPSAIHVLAKSPPSETPGEGGGTIVAGLLAIDGMLDLNLSDAELIAIGDAAGVRPPDFSASLRGSRVVVHPACDEPQTPEPRRPPVPSPDEARRAFDGGDVLLHAIYPDYYAPDATLEPLYPTSLRRVLRRAFHRIAAWNSR